MTAVIKQNSQVPSATTRKRIVRHCHAAPSVELPICVVVRYLTLQTGLDMGAHCAPLRQKKSSAVPLSRSGHMSVICARPSRKEVGVKRVETVGVYPLAPPRGAANPRAPQSATPRLISSEKPPARKGTNMPARFRYPGQSVQEKVPPGQNVALRASYAPESRRFLKTKRKTTHFREWFSWWKLTGSNR